MANAFMIRNVSNEPFYSPFEKYIDDGLTRIFRAIDRSLTRAYDARIEGKSPFTVVPECKTSAYTPTGCHRLVDSEAECFPKREHLDMARHCSTAIANGLYLYVTRSKNQLSQEQTDEIERSIRCNCDLPERQ
jgi:hypothetical protein